jgi:hypothetical protein
MVQLNNHNLFKNRTIVENQHTNTDKILTKTTFIIIGQITLL